MSRKFLAGYTRAQVEAYVRMQLGISDEWAKRACLRLYKGQTPSEKRNRVTKSRNGVGFNRFDAPLLSEIAIRLEAHRENKKDLILLKAIIPRYTRQMVGLSNSPRLLTLVHGYYTRTTLPPY